MTKIGETGAHQYIPENISKQAKLPLLDKLPSAPAPIRPNLIPLHDLSKFILPENISPAAISKNPSGAKALNALLALAALQGIKDGVNGT